MIRRPDGTFFGYKLWTLVEHAMPTFTNEPISFDKYDLIDRMPFIEEYKKDPSNYEVLEDKPDYKIIMNFTRNLTDTFLIVGFDPRIADYKSIFFVVECGIATVPHSTKTTLVQTLLWRNKRPPGFDVVSFVFEHLLSQVGSIMTDKIQTKQGKEFWLRLTDEAYKRRLHVYVTTPDEFKDVSKNKNFIRANIENIWGYINKASIRVIISKSKIRPVQ